MPAFEINQETEQECESGDVNQSFDVSQTGDNSNQTVGLQGTANTGCAQNVIDVVDVSPFGNFDGNDDGFFGGNGSDFEFDDVGSSIEVSPTNMVASDQEVNQAASAFGS